MLDNYFNSKNASEFGLKIVYRPSIPSPEENITEYTVPGRNGSLTHKDGTYKDIVYPVEYNIIDFNNIYGKIRAIKGWLLGKIIDKKLIFSDDPEVFYKVKTVFATDVERRIKVSGEFTATYTMEPFAYERNVEDIILTAPGNVINTGTIYSEPIITVEGTGNITLTINNKNIILTGIQTGIVIDSVMKNAYLGSTNLNSKMNGKFPVLEIGENEISWIGNITKLTVSPNWRYL